MVSRCFRQFMPAFLVGLSLASTASLADDVRYDGHQVVRAIPVNRAQLQAIESLSPDIWSHGVAIGRSIDFRLPPDLIDDLADAGVSFEVLIDDVQALIDAETEWENTPTLGGSWFADYKTYAEHMAYLDTLAAVNPAIASTFLVGNSLEGRQIRGIRIGSSDPNAPAFVMQGCQHAREWVSPMVCQFVADHLVRQYGSDPDVTRLVDDVAFYIIPVVNPDGYVYTWGPDRLWRKNRRNNGNGTFGVDLNRNWSVGFGGEGSSGQGNSETYRGTAAFSEPESAAVRDFVLGLNNRAVFLDIHSYSQLILAPYGWTPNLPADHALFEQLGADMRAIIGSVHGEDYVNGPCYSLLYPASGIASDWGYDAAGAIGFGFELRDTGQFGFILPADQIIPNGEEIVPAMLYLADHVSRAITISFPDGLPSIIPPGTASPLDVDIVAMNGNVIESGSPTLHWRVGTSGAFTADPLNSLGGTQYQATLPPAPCGSTVQFYVSAETTDGDVGTSPDDAPASVHSTLAVNLVEVLADDFETDLGWTVQNVDLTDGAWNRGLPLGDGSRGDPTSDFDGSGRCYLTDNAAGNSDVDGGPTRLLSPVLDLSSAPDAVVSYARWFFNDDNDGDRLTVEVSNNNGSTWTLVESVGNTGGWTTHSFRVADFVAPTSQVRVRFNATDNPNDSVTEAGIDAFNVSETSCDAGTELTGFTVVRGTLLGGGLPDLASSDDATLDIRSGFGSTFVDLHSMFLQVRAVTSVQTPATIDLTVESRIDEPSGTMRLMLRNWNTNAFVQVGSFAVGMTDTVHVVNGIAAANYVNASGEIDAQVRHLFFIPVFAYRFDSFIDHIGIEVD